MPAHRLHNSSTGSDCTVAVRPGITILERLGAPYMLYAQQSRILRCNSSLFSAMFLTLRVSWALYSDAL